MKSIFRKTILLGVILACFIVSGGSASSLFFYPDVVETNPGDTPEISLMMEGVGEGLSGYSLLITVDDPTTASILAIRFPEWADLESTEILNSTTIQIRAADTSRQIQEGTAVIVLADIILNARSAGYAQIQVTPLIIDDDKKGRYSPFTSTGSIVISGAGPVPPSPIIPMTP